MLVIRTGIRRISVAFIVTAAIAFGFYQHTKAANLTVCASGCTYTNSQLQNAIDAANPGDVILLQQNTEYRDEFLLRQKSCPANDSTCYITIRTGVNSTGGLLSTSLFPSANIRLTPSYSNILAKLVNNSVTTPAVRTVEPSEFGGGCTVAPCVANWYKFQWVEFHHDPTIVGSTSGGELVRLGSQDPTTDSANGDNQDKVSETPSHFIFDQVYVHGDVNRGGIRGISIHAKDFTLTNSWCEDIKNITKDGQCIYINNSDGPYTIINNYIRADGENLLSGGDVPQNHHTATVNASPAPTATSATLSSVVELSVGQVMGCDVGAKRDLVTVLSISGNAVTFTAAPDGALATPGFCGWGLVPKNLTFQKNLVTKDLAWRNPLIDTVTGVSATAQATGGTLTAGTYYYKIQARRDVAGGTARSTSSAEVSATIEAGVTTGSITITWNAGTSAADVYRVYGRSSGGENIYFTINAPTTTFTDTGGAGTSGAVPTTAGTTWNIKNLFELKDMDTALIEGNIFDGSWLDAQQGYGILFTGSNSGSSTTKTNPSTGDSNITFRNNIVRNVASALQITSHDQASSTTYAISRRATNISFTNNLIYDSGRDFTNQSQPVIQINAPGSADSAPREGAKDVVISHNTLLFSGSNGFLIVPLGVGGVDYKLENFTFTNNIMRRGTYGMRYVRSPGGTQAEGTTSWDMMQMATSIFSKNVMQGATCSLYPGGLASNYCPSETTLQSNFVNFANDDYHLAPTSSWIGAGTDGQDIGANVNTITALTDIAVSGDNTGTAPPVVPPTITTTTIPNGQVAQVYSTTFAATDCTSSCSWTITSGALPAGLTLSTVGVISGTPTLAGSYTITTQAHASTSGLNASKTFSFTILDIPPPPNPGPPRPVRMDYVENGIFVRSDEPTIDADGIRTGDIWVDLTNNLVKWLTSTSPVSVWYTFLTDNSTLNVAKLNVTGTPDATTFLKYDGTTAIWAAPAASSTRATNVMFMAPGSANPVDWVLTAGASNELLNSATNRVRFDLSAYTQCKIWARVARLVIGVTSVLYPEYTIDDGTTWNVLGTSAQTPGIDLTVNNNNGMPYSAWVNIVAGAKVDSVEMRIRATQGAGTITQQPQFGNIGITCK